MISRPRGSYRGFEAGRAVTAYAAEDSAHERSFSVMSWNVLADRLA
jgi:hypothetical protein